MFRSSLLVAALFVTGCGMEAQVPRRGEEPQELTHQEPTTQQPASERLQITQLTPSFLPQQLVPLMDTLSIHSMPVADGTQVRYLLGMMGCGISVVAQGSAQVRGGAFEIQYDPALSEFGQMSLFFQIGSEVCDPETTQVYEVPAQLPGSVDLSVLPAESFAGCWMFGN
jgi:hypothetical protein